MATESGEMKQNEQDPSEIRADIDETRANLAETISAIQKKLNPQRLKDEAVSSVRAATVGRVETVADDAKWKAKGVGEDVIETIKSNPAPALLTAVGLGWLFMESRNRQRRSESQRRSGDRYYYAGESQGRGYEYRGESEYTRGAEYGRGADYGRGGQYRGGSEYGYADYDQRGYREGQYEDRRGRLMQAGQNVRERAGDVVGSASSKVQDVASTAGSKVQDVASTAGSKVQDAASAAGSKVQDVASTASEKVQDVASGVADTASQVAESARYGAYQVKQEAQYRAQRATTRFGEIMEENPLIIGAAAVALGAVIGFAFPATEKENEIFGEARDKVMDRAQEVVSEKAQQVQQVAQEVAPVIKDTVKDTVKSAAERQNLTGGSNS